jgi:glycine/D-amino acid oxidase-like deaminating enzyme
MNGEGWRLPPTATRDEHVVMVGAGIVNLMTAWRLASAGYRIDIYDTGAGLPSTPDVMGYGCTLAGGNARMFTLTEADVYNTDTLAKSAKSSVLDIAISAGGWRAFPEEGGTSKERQWAQEFQDVPSALSDRYESDIIDLNREAGHCWESCIRHQPSLFNSSGLLRGILRIYENSSSLEHAIKRTCRIGALQRTFSVREVETTYPALALACQGGEIAGGIMVTGFTLGIHDFFLGLVALLRRYGVQFHWRHEIDRIEWLGSSGEVVALRDYRGELIKAANYVISTGVYGHRLLEGTEAGRQIQGVFGVWISIPNIDPPLTNSAKLRRDEHVTPDTNITVIDDPLRGPVLILGAGYGWTGVSPGNIDATELMTLYDGIEDTARRFFPEAYLLASANGWLQKTRRWCVRPWTPSSLGIFEVFPTASGGSLIVTGGHNTGGFAQAPAVGEAVLAALEGAAHPMHTCYDPRRMRHDLG